MMKQLRALAGARTAKAFGRSRAARAVKRARMAARAAEQKTNQ